ncbi:MAG: hypothetical protein HQM03_14380 [Magnetococcales bacterium]|nr:hypothetical protein [Magnetococcales bacterium]
MSLAALAPPGNTPSIKNLNPANQAKSRAAAQAEKEVSRAPKKMVEPQQANKQLYRQDSSAETVKKQNAKNTKKTDIRA